MLDVIPENLSFFFTGKGLLKLICLQAASAKLSDANKTKRKFSSFFKSLVIELDKELYGPDNHLVEVSFIFVPFVTIL